LKVVRLKTFLLLSRQLWNLAVMSRTRRDSILQQPWNKKIAYGMLAELATVFLMVYIPQVNRVFNTRPLTWEYFVYPAGMGAVLALMQELLKFARQRSPCMEAVFGW
jgi:hypothetical protein